MVQVDVFWAYGLGATLAAVSGPRLAKEESIFVNRTFVISLLYLTLIWPPTGMLLLLRHPSWETMQVASSLASIPPFVVLAFCITNVTQGILGFWVSARLFAGGRTYLAHLNWMFGYMGMFFILLYGWDGHGFDRFLYDRDMFGGIPWTSGAGFQEGAGPRFFISTVAMTLYLDGLYLIPPLTWLIGTWTRDSARDHLPTHAVPQSMTKVVFLHLFLVFGVTLPTCAGAALVCRLLQPFTGHVLNYVIGLPLSVLVAYLLFYRPGMPVYRLVRHICPALHVGDFTPQIVSRKQA